MAKVPYARIIIVVHAEEKEIDGPNELALSDQVYEVVCELEEWLRSRTLGGEFDFEVIES